MVIKSYKHVLPTGYEGLSDGVQVREMITAQDGAPTFAMRVFDVAPGAATPYHTHGWEHEVYIVSGTGRVRAEGTDTPFKPGDSIYIAPNEQHCFMADSGVPVQMICCIPSKDQCRL
ncbi:MAG TPA: cupin domain-containing protein [Nitrospira sp.]|nr:cupin domain-containing protein [Nitrospira sp.]